MVRVSVQSKATENAVVTLLKRKMVFKRGSTTEQEEVDANERHEYHVELILNDEDGRVEGAMVVEQKEGVRGDTTYQLVEVTRLRQ